MECTDRRCSRQMDATVLVTNNRDRSEGTAVFRDIGGHVWVAGSYHNSFTMGELGSGTSTAQTVSASGPHAFLAYLTRDLGLLGLRGLGTEIDGVGLGINEEGGIVYLTRAKLDGRRRVVVVTGLERRGTRRRFVPIRFVDALNTPRVVVDGRGNGYLAVTFAGDMRVVYRDPPPLCAEDHEQNSCDGCGFKRYCRHCELRNRTCKLVSVATRSTALFRISPRGEVELLRQFDALDLEAIVIEPAEVCAHDHERRLALLGLRMDELATFVLKVCSLTGEVEETEDYHVLETVDDSISTSSQDYDLAWDPTDDRLYATIGVFDPIQVRGEVYNHSRQPGVVVITDGKVRFLCLHPVPRVEGNDVEFRLATSAYRGLVILVNTSVSVGGVREFALGLFDLRHGQSATFIQGTTQIRGQSIYADKHTILVVGGASERLIVERCGSDSIVVDLSQSINLFVLELLRD